MRMSPLTVGSSTRMPSTTLNRPPAASVLPSRAAPLSIFQPSRFLPLNSGVNPGSALASSALEAGGRQNKPTSRPQYRARMKHLTGREGPSRRPRQPAGQVAGQDLAQRGVGPQAHMVDVLHQTAGVQLLQEGGERLQVAVAERPRVG